VLDEAFEILVAPDQLAGQRQGAGVLGFDRVGGGGRTAPGYGHEDRQIPALQPQRSTEKFDGRPLGAYRSAGFQVADGPHADFRLIRQLGLGQPGGEAVAAKQRGEAVLSGRFSCRNVGPHGQED
jgi:hypothetical protein